MRETTIEIEGMTCDGCVRAVRDTLERHQGTWPREVAIGRAVVGYDPGRTNENRIVDAVEDAGFPARVVDVSEVAESEAE